MKKTADWFTQNKLIVNENKTNAVLFSTRNKKVMRPEHLHLENNDLNLEHKTKFLGLTIDEYLSWEQNIDSLCLKLSRIGYGIGVGSG